MAARGEQSRSGRGEPLVRSQGSSGLRRAARCLGGGGVRLGFPSCNGTQLGQRSARVS
ncbi:UNVERIFIED_CONTAM: hypothetical protein Sradi_3558100 [Sesamum radiatum]|uniref:Uncharacterized protein n=1 Tax=Sesamum radiatum TaxID=300843 RepID=A0AAW2QFN6_SESRA